MLNVLLLFLHRINEFDSFEIIDPIVTYIGDAAVLTFNIISYGRQRGRTHALELHGGLPPLGGKMAYYSYALVPYAGWPLTAIVNARSRS